MLLLIKCLSLLPLCVCLCVWGWGVGVFLSVFCVVVLRILSSFAIVLLKKRELVVSPTRCVDYVVISCSHCMWGTAWGRG